MGAQTFLSRIILEPRFESVSRLNKNSVQLCSILFDYRSRLETHPEGRPKDENGMLPPRLIIILIILLRLIITTIIIQIPLSRPHLLVILSSFSSSSSSAPLARRPLPARSVYYRDSDDSRTATPRATRHAPRFRVSGPFGTPLERLWILFPPAPPKNWGIVWGCFWTVLGTVWGQLGDG